MHDERLPNIAMHEKMVGGMRTAGRPVRRQQDNAMENCSDFGRDEPSWAQGTQYVSDGYRIVEEGNKMYMNTDQRAPCKGTFAAAYFLLHPSSCRIGME